MALTISDRQDKNSKGAKEVKNVIVNQVVENKAGTLLSIYNQTKFGVLAGRAI
jgi:hypothetical protein